MTDLSVRFSQRSSVRRAIAAFTFVLLLVVVLPAWAVQTSPSEILANPDKYDGQDVTITGTITNLRETVSRKGNPYYLFGAISR